MADVQERKRAVVTGSNLERLLDAEQRLSRFQPGTEEYRAELREILGIRVGKPEKRPPPNAAERIERLAADGCTSIVDLAAALRVDRGTLRRWLLEDESLQLAFAIGREKERDELHRILIRDARDGEKPNVNAMFLLKARHGYREGEPADSGIPRVSVTFNLPGAMSRDDFLKTVVSDERGSS
jgi:hypothetical protein